ncbi:MAG: hypothetical protein FJX74_02590 [Armatimonadetes bacterium]|nr:hypothetical protein [Armatimonadota bacterium]
MRRRLLTSIVIALAVAIPTAAALALDCSGIETCPLSNIDGCMGYYMKTGNYCESTFECESETQCCQYLWLCEMTTPCCGWTFKWHYTGMMMGQCMGYWEASCPGGFFALDNSCNSPCYIIGLDEQCYKGTVSHGLRLCAGSGGCPSQPAPPANKCIDGQLGGPVALGGCWWRSVSGS